ncbi:hypothetical protein [Shewanella surugensis]|uniref:Flagellar protein FliT n=1 Tax=Shewanella surugensis TaxID=212020 RepID=A0ABT0LFL7_9GAMM|nr:hypothetical protein [Shewanella surugensis]MCL1126506.1 hypothetical protein [Shewanella surugensis]
MSEKVGPTSAEPLAMKPWGQFEAALIKHAEKQDWDKLAKVNTLMIKALKHAGAPKTQSQLLARESLANTHSEVLKKLIHSKHTLEMEMQQFTSTQDGLAAYQLTQLSGALDDR